MLSAVKLELLQRPVTAYGLSNGKGDMITFFAERSPPRSVASAGTWSALVRPGRRVGIMLMLLLAPRRIAADRGGALRACGRLAVAEDGHAFSWWSASQRALLNQSIGSLALSEACAWDCVHRADPLPLCALRKVC